MNHKNTYPVDFFELFGSGQDDDMVEPSEPSCISEEILNLEESREQRIEIGKFEGKYDIPDDIDDCNDDVLKLMGNH